MTAAQQTAIVNKFNEEQKRLAARMAAEMQTWGDIAKRYPKGKEPVQVRTALARIEAVRKNMQARASKIEQLAKANNALNQVRSLASSTLQKAKNTFSQGWGKVKGFLGIGIEPASLTILLFAVGGAAAITWMVTYVMTQGDVQIKQDLSTLETLSALREQLTPADRKKMDADLAKLQKEAAAQASQQTKSGSITETVNLGLYIGLGFLALKAVEQLKSK